MLRLIALIGTVVLTVASGCSWQQAYSTTQEWQRNQCNRLPEQTERERCTSMSYEDYQRQTEATKKN